MAISVFPYQSNTKEAANGPVFSVGVISKSDLRHRRFGFGIHFSSPMSIMKGQLKQSDAAILSQMQNFPNQWLSKPSIISKEQSLTLKWSQAAT